MHEHALWYFCDQVIQDCKLFQVPSTTIMFVEHDFLLLYTFLQYRSHVKHMKYA